MLSVKARNEGLAHLGKVLPYEKVRVSPAGELGVAVGTSTSWYGHNAAQFSP